MEVYYGLALAVALLYIIRLLVCDAGGRESKVDRINNSLIGLAVFLLFALRSTSVGVDVGNYVARFQSGRDLETRKMALEISYSALNDGIRLLTSDPHVFIAFVAALTIAPITWTIGKTSENIYLSWILFMTIGPFTFMLSGLRQGIALAIAFATLPLLAKRKILVPLLLIGFAATFHTSALIFLPAIFLHRMRLNVRTAFALAAILIVLAFFGEQLVAFAIESVYDTYEVVDTGAYRWSLVNAALWLSLLPLYRPMSMRLPEYAGLFLVVLAGVLLLTLTAFATNIGRSARYYLQFFAILAPNALSMMADRRVRTLLAVVLNIAALTYFFLTVGQTAYEVVPYQFMWED